MITMVDHTGYSLVLNVILYTIFRQHRPCKCSNGNSMIQIGSLYGSKCK